MGFYHLDLDALSAHTGIGIDGLKAKSWTDLESMAKDMEREKIMRQNDGNARDGEYKRLVLRFFEPLGLLRHWFDDTQIVLACAYAGVGERDLCMEKFVKPGARKDYWEHFGEYLRTSTESVPAYDRDGREYLEREQREVDVYRVKNEYQHLCHGNVVRHLLYGRYPELAKFGFKFYGLSAGECDYEIYPENGIYTPFTALMSGDVDWILHRNRTYCRTYNNGRYSPAECEKVFRTENARGMFDLVKSIGRREKAAGHSPVSMDGDGKLVMPNGLLQASPDGDVIILRQNPMRYETPMFKLEYKAPMTVGVLAAKFLALVGFAKIDLHIYEDADYLGEHGVHVKDIAKGPDLDSMPAHVRGDMVCGAFGVRHGNRFDLTLRVERL